MISPVFVSIPSSISPQAATDNRPHKNRYLVFLKIIASSSVCRVIPPRGAHRSAGENVARAFVGNKSCGGCATRLLRRRDRRSRAARPRPVGVPRGGGHGRRHGRRDAGHKGALKVSSQLGQGTTFGVLLPEQARTRFRRRRTPDRGRAPRAPGARLARGQIVVERVLGADALRVAVRNHRSWIDRVRLLPQRLPRGLCQKLNFTAGFDADPPNCGGSPLPLQTTAVSFDPADPRWANQYQACLASEGCTFCNGECADFCRAVAAAEGIDPAGTAITSCSWSCTVENQLLITEPAAACGG